MTTASTKTVVVVADAAQRRVGGYIQGPIRERCLALWVDSEGGEVLIDVKDFPVCLASIFENDM